MLNASDTYMTDTHTRKESPVNMSYSVANDIPFEELRRRLCPEKHHHYCRTCGPTWVLGVGNNKITRVGNGSEGIPCPEIADHAHNLCFCCGKMLVVFTLEGNPDPNAALQAWATAHVHDSYMQRREWENWAIRRIAELRREHAQRPMRAAAIGAAWSMFVFYQDRAFLFAVFFLALLLFQQLLATPPASPDWLGLLISVTAAACLYGLHRVLARERRMRAVFWLLRTRFTYALREHLQTVFGYGEFFAEHSSTGDIGDYIKGFEKAELEVVESLKMLKQMDEQHERAVNSAA
jgi:hypothetical protein